MVFHLHRNTQPSQAGELPAGKKEEPAMRWLWRRTLQLRVWRDRNGQDFIEYALAVGMMAVIAVAATPTLTETVRSVFSKLSTVLISTAGG
jgi:Flp pilus assembly pilin Flp